MGLEKANIIPIHLKRFFTFMQMSITNAHTKKKNTIIYSCKRNCRLTAHTIASIMLAPFLHKPYQKIREKKKIIININTINKTLIRHNLTINISCLFLIINNLHDGAGIWVLIAKHVGVVIVHGGLCDGCSDWNGSDMIRRCLLVISLRNIRICY